MHRAGATVGNENAVDKRQPQDAMILAVADDRLMAFLVLGAMIG